MTEHVETRAFGSVPADGDPRHAVLRRHASASLRGKGCCWSGAQGLALFLLSLWGFCSPSRAVSTRPAEAFPKHV